MSQTSRRVSYWLNHRPIPRLTQPHPTATYFLWKFAIQQCGSRLLHVDLSSWNFICGGNFVCGIQFVGNLFEGACRQLDKMGCGHHIQLVFRQLKCTHVALNSLHICFGSCCWKWNRGKSSTRSYCSANSFFRREWTMFRYKTLQL